MKYTALAAVTASLFMASANAAPAMIDENSLSEILSIAKSYGTAEMGSNASGNPKITGRMDGTQYVIDFYDCEGNVCKNMLFYAGWDVDTARADDINTFNRDTRFGKAYVDSVGDVALEMPVNLAYGVSYKNFDDTMDWWKVAVTSFKTRYFEK